MTALVPRSSLMFAEASLRSKRQGVPKLMFGLVRRVRLGGLRDIGATSAEGERMARWLEREHWKRGDLCTARSLWNYRPRSAFRERD
jgi:hypothetical protein